MRYLIQIFTVGLFLVPLTRAGTPEYWQRSMMNERRSTDAPHEVDLTGVAQRGILIGELWVKNKSPEELDSPGAVMVIEGNPESDGTFWLVAELQVQKEKDSEWIKIGLSGNEKALSRLQIYSGMMVAGLRINLDPFKAHLGKFRFGRIVLKSGDEAVFLLDDLKPPTEEKNK